MSVGRRLLDLRHRQRDLANVAERQRPAPRGFLGSHRRRVLSAAAHQVAPASSIPRAPYVSRLSRAHVDLVSVLHLACVQRTLSEQGDSPHLRISARGADRRLRRLRPRRRRAQGPADPARASSRSRQVGAARRLRARRRDARRRGAPRARGGDRHRARSFSSSSTPSARSTAIRASGWSRSPTTRSSSSRDHRVQAATDASDAAWFGVHDLPSLAFDHARILAMALERLRGKVRYQPIGFELLPPKFTLSQLQRLYEIVLERSRSTSATSARRSSRWICWWSPTRSSRTSRHRAARLYRFDDANTNDWRSRASTSSSEAVIQSGYGPPRGNAVGPRRRQARAERRRSARASSRSVHASGRVARDRGVSVRAAAHGQWGDEPQADSGTDLAGVIESVGKKVTRFKVGDDVFGECAKHGWMNGGAYAEYAAVPQDYLALKPKNVSFEQAAAVPTAGAIALNNLGGAARPKRQTVLVNGAGGCMGPIAVQIAKADGARVTAVDCAAKLPMLRALGADHVIDYEKEGLPSHRRALRFHSGRRGHPAYADEYRHALTPNGDYMPIGHAHYDNTSQSHHGRHPEVSRPRVQSHARSGIA